jgi:hypothetical protein
VSAFTGRHICVLLSPRGKSGKLCVWAFPLKNVESFSLSIGVRITMIGCAVYLLRIFKMFHGLMNNPVFVIFLILRFILLLPSEGAF